MSDSCNWLRRKAKSEEENKQDFYQTNPHLTFALYEHMKNVLDKDARILDPCAGQRAIGNVLRHHFTNLTEFDLYDPENPVDFLKYEPHEKFNAVVMNPPFTTKFKFIDKALEVADRVYCLFPGLGLNYNITGIYKARPEYRGQISCYPKINLSPELDPKGGADWGGTSIYVWHEYISDSTDKNKPKWESVVDVREKYGDLVKQYCLDTMQGD